MFTLQDQTGWEEKKKKKVCKVCRNRGNQLIADKLLQIVQLATRLSFTELGYHYLINHSESSHSRFQLRNFFCNNFVFQEPPLLH